MSTWMPATNSACSMTYRPVTPRNVGTSDRAARTMLLEVTTTTAGMRVTSDRIMNAASSPTAYRPHTVSTKPVASRLSNPNGSNTFQDRVSSWSSRSRGYVHRIHIRKNTRANILVRNHTSDGKTCDSPARVPKNITRLSRSPSPASIKIGRTSRVWRRPVVRITAATTRQPSVTSSHIYGCRCGSVQPPKNIIVATAAIPNISPYSPNWNRANRMPVYSAKYPATSSDSASGKSNGTRLTSAVAAVRKVRLARSPNGSPNHPIGEGSLNINQLPCLTCASTMPTVDRAPATIAAHRMPRASGISSRIICEAERSPPKSAYLLLLDQPPA